MPIYAYRCATCGHARDVLRKMSDPVLTECPACGASTFVKQLTAAGFQLKGSGWYVTDFKSGASARPDAADGAKTDAANGDAAKADSAKGDAANGDATKSDSARSDASQGDSTKSQPVNRGDTGKGGPANGDAARSGTPAAALTPKNGSPASVAPAAPASGAKPG